ncbi:MAG: DUF3649 domain-containing protein [Burkholderiales bacterium]|nr:DUF3649 domain-containing protein [Burkholderiales bacterium]
MPSRTIHAACGPFCARKPRHACAGMTVV